MRRPPGGVNPTDFLTNFNVIVPYRVRSPIALSRLDCRAGVRVPPPPKRRATGIFTGVA
ncbi:MAG: hypothetical protein ACP5D7_06570 [Limnospira sp.]